MSKKNPRSGNTEITPKLLRAFAKGELDEVTEDMVIAVLGKKPKLQAKVAAISINQVLAKMANSDSRFASAKSLSSQFTDANSEPTKVSESASSPPKNIPPELSEMAEYRIVRELGRGGMGVVYLAENLWMGKRKEVLKVLTEQLVANEEAMTRFRQEIECTASLDHPNIVRSYSVRPLKKSVVFSMEYVPGRDLHQFLSKNGKLPIHVACGIASEICEGLQHAMSKKLVHRDIKPSNVILYKSGGKIRAKILDFGLARLSNDDSAEGLTRFGTLLGTLEYISPEQSLNAMSADNRSDIYSLGCTLYHMLVGHPPFSGSPGELILAHSQKDPPLLNLIRPEIPTKLAAIVAKMLAKEPGRRFQSPQDIIAKLKPFLSRQSQSLFSAIEEIPPGPETVGPQAEALFDTSIEIKPGDDLVLEPLDVLFTPRPNSFANPQSLRPLPGLPKSAFQRNKVRSKTGKQNTPKNANKGAKNTNQLQTLIDGWGGNKKVGLIIGAAAMGFFCLCLLAIGIIKIRTANGTIWIEGLPPNAEVIVDGNEVEIKWDINRATVTARTGERKIEVVKDGITVMRESLTIQDNSRGIIMFLKYRENQPVISNIASANTVSSKAMSERSVWQITSYEGKFIQQDEKNWIEVGRDEKVVRFSFEEVTRTVDYVELYDKNRRLGIRLKSSNFQIKYHGGQWSNSSSGKWISESNTDIPKLETPLSPEINSGASSGIQWARRRRSDNQK